MFREKLITSGQSKGGKNQPFLMEGNRLSLQLQHYPKADPLSPPGLLSYEVGVWVVDGDGW